MASKTWYCYNRSCRTPLGVIVNGELSIRHGDDNIGAINTDGAMLVVLCSKCGRPCKWVPRDSALVEAVMNTHFMKAVVANGTKIIITSKNQIEAAEVEGKEE